MASDKISEKQLEALRSYDRDGEFCDLSDYDNAGTLGWRNRERVIDALRARGLFNDDGITAAGRAALTKASGVTP